MRVETQNLGDVVFYRIAGDLNFSNWNKVTDDLEDLYKSGHRFIVLNWEAIDVIDTSGLQTLVFLFKKKQKDPEFHFALVTDNPIHIKIITLCGFNSFVNIYPTEEEAMSHVALC
jgi:anti-anti-sigma factor